MVELTQKFGQTHNMMRMLRTTVNPCNSRTITTILIKVSMLAMPLERLVPPLQYRPTVNLTNAKYADARLQNAISASKLSKMCGYETLM
jgi:hypothetical protein